jgi:hypothetical protein
MYVWFDVCEGKILGQSGATARVKPIFLAPYPKKCTQMCTPLTSVYAGLPV